MFLTSFRVGDDVREEVLDALLPLLPAGLHENGEVLVYTADVVQKCTEYVKNRLPNANAA